MGQGEGSGSAAPPLDSGLRLNLSVMMLLQYAIWGAWFSVLGNRLVAMGLSEHIGSIFGTMALGTIFAPLVTGQIADRYFSSEKLMALLHLAGAGFLYWLATIDEVPAVDATLTGQALEAAKLAHAAAVQATAFKFYWIALGYALIYSPTLALSNSIAFTHIPDGTRDFPSIRVLGTIGWIVAGLAVGMGLRLVYDDPKTSNGPLLMAAAFSLALGLYSFALPHTPPKGKAGDVLPFLRAVRLLKEPSFAVFYSVSFIITIVLAFYYNYTGTYLEKHLGVKDVASTMTIGQWSEMLLLPLLPLFLYRLGMKWVLAVGMLAWGLRYGVFAWGGTMDFGVFFWPVLFSLAFHGVCYDFFFAAGFIHVDNESPGDIKGSAQALFVFLTYGLAMWLGSELSNLVFKHYTTKQPGEGGKLVDVTDWASFWTVPSVGVLIALVLFVAFFHLRKKEKVSGVA